MAKLLGGTTVYGLLSTTGTAYSSAVQVGVTSTIAPLNISPLTITAAASGSVFNQIQNITPGISASTDISLYNDLGTNYIDIGINSSRYNGNSYTPTFNIIGSNDSYVFATTGNLSIGNTGSIGDFIIHTGGALSGTSASSGNERLRIKNTNASGNGGYIGINTSNPNQQLTVTGSISSSSTIYDKSGNSTNWNSSYTTLCSNSAYWTTSTNITANIAAGNIGIGYVVPAGTTLQQFITDLITTVYYPTINSYPSVSLGTDIGSTVEAGTSASSITFTNYYDPGSVYGRLVGGFWNAGSRAGNLAGSALRYTVNGVNVGTTNPYTSSVNIQFGDGSTTFTNSVSYGTGAQYTDSAGNNWSTPYPSGTTSGSTSINGVRSLFYGTNITNVSSIKSSDVRALANQTLGPYPGQQITINVTTSPPTNNVAFAYPASLGAAAHAYNSGTGYDDLGAFNLYTVSVSGANGYTPVSTYVYVLTGSFTTNYNYTITI